MLNTAEYESLLKRHGFLGKNAGKVRLRRGVRTRMDDNSWKTTGWTTVADNLTALVQVAKNAAEGDIGEQDPTIRGAIVIPRGTEPKIGDGIVVLTGEHTGMKFRIIDVVSLGGVAYDCAGIATVENFQ